MPEGSVDIDGEGFAPDEDIETQTPSVDNQDSKTSESGDQGKSPETKEAEPQGEADNKDVKVTEKGTKLDPNPLSAVNQQLANERRQRLEMEQFLSDKTALKRYLEDLERETATEPAKPDDISIDKVETVEDVQKFLNQYTKKVDNEVNELKKLKQGIASQAVEERIGKTIQTEIDEVRRSYAELRPKNPDGSDNPDFDPDLEKELGDLFDELDFDQKGNKYRGSVSLKRLAERFMKVAKRGQDVGSKKAQTVVQDKRTGRVISGTISESQPDESGMSASQTIAARMKRAAGNR